MVGPIEIFGSPIMAMNKPKTFSPAALLDHPTQQRVFLPRLGLAKEPEQFNATSRQAKQTRLARPPQSLL